MIPVFRPWLTLGNIFDTNKALFQKQISIEPPFGWLERVCNSRRAHNAFRAQ